LRLGANGNSTAQFSEGSGTDSATASLTYNVNGTGTLDATAELVGNELTVVFNGFIESGGGLYPQLSAVVSATSQIDVPHFSAPWTTVFFRLIEVDARPPELTDPTVWVDIDGGIDSEFLGEQMSGLQDTTGPDRTGRILQLLAGDTVNVAVRVTAASRTSSSTPLAFTWRHRLEIYAIGPSDHPLFSVP
jgi:hypothetical protein